MLFDFVFAALLIIGCVLNSGAVQVQSFEISDDESDTCPTSLWWVTQKNRTCQCIHNMPDSVLNCNNLSLYVDLGYCISMNGQEYVVGPCPYLPDLDVNIDSLQYHIPTDIQGQELNNTCMPFKRQGVNCEKCVSGHGPAIFSDSITCADCSKYRHVWFLHFLFQLFLETAMFITLTFTKPHRMFSLINVLTFYWQMILYAITTNSSLYEVLITTTNSKVLRFLLTVYGVWNLDFIRYLMPPLCISSGTKAINTFWFDIVVVLYPFLLCCFLLLCVKLHNRNNRIFSFILRPLGRIFRREWNLKCSAAVTFAVFLVSGYSKLLFTCLKLLKGVQAQHSINGTAVYNKLTFYYDPSIKYLSPEHIPYIITVVVLLITFILIPPLLLILYPVRLCRKCINYLGFQQSEFLGTIINTFQWGYKNGTEGTFDYRWLSSLYMILRIGIACEFVFVVMPSNNQNAGLPWAITGLVLIGFGAVYFTVEPFCVSWMNKFDGFTLTLLGLLALTINFRDKFVYIIALVISLKPWVIIGSNSLMKLCCWALRSAAVKRTKRKLKFKFERCMQHGRRDSEEEEPLLEESLSDMPDRILNPEYYAVPELHITEGGTSQRTRSMNVPTYGVV